jgi:hypothetical protein
MRVGGNQASIFLLAASHLRSEFSPRWAWRDRVANRVRCENAEDDTLNSCNLPETQRGW